MDSTSQNPVDSFAKKTLIVLLRILIDPQRVLKEVTQYRREILFIFGVSTGSAILEALFAPSRRPALLNFFDPYVTKSPMVQKIGMVLYSPIATMLLEILLFSFFVYGAYSVSKVFKGDHEYRLPEFVLGVIAISGIGIVARIVMLLINFFPLSLYKAFVSYLFFFWVVILTIMFLKNSQRLSWSKALIAFIVPAFFVIALGGLPAIAPYLAWLSR